MHSGGNKEVFLYCAMKSKKRGVFLSMSITGGNLMYVQDRIYSKGKEVPWENAIILEGNEIFTLTGLEPGTNYR